MMSVVIPHPHGTRVQSLGAHKLGSPGESGELGHGFLHQDWVCASPQGQDRRRARIESIVFAGHEVAPVQLRSGTLEIHFPRLHVECDRPVCFAGESKGFHSCLGAPRHFTAVRSVVGDQQTPSRLSIRDVLGEVCEALDDPFQVVVDVQMVFFHIQNGGVSGAVGMKRTIEFASFGHHQARKARHGADGDFGGTHLAPATKLRDVGPDDERGR